MKLAPINNATSSTEPFIVNCKNTADWLISNYDDDIWEIIDTRLPSRNTFRIRFNVVVSDRARPNENCRLTDREYSQILSTIKAQIFGLRSGKFATVNSAKVHESMARAIINWALWMILNNTKCFSHLTPEDFEAYREAAVYGPGYLLQYSPRLIEFVKKYRAAGNSIPITITSNARPRLNITELLTLAKIDPARGCMDHCVCYQLLKIAEEENFYLTPHQQKKLSLDPPQPKKLVNIPLLRMLQPWDYQWRMRALFCGKGIQFNAFEESSPDKMAGEIGVPKGRTSTAPVQQTMELIDCSLRWVLDYAPVLFELRTEFERLLAEKFNKETRHNRMKKIVGKTVLPEGAGSVKQLDAGTKRIANGVSFGMALLEFLPVACFIIIAAFTARRLEEVLSIRAAGIENEDV